MSWQALDWASKQKTGNGTNKLVLISLANYADDANTCFPSFKTLVNITELSRSTIIRSLKDLESKGLINANRVVVFDRVTFNQDIFITHHDGLTGEKCNYYLELEQVSLGSVENAVATLKNIKNRS